MDKFRIGHYQITPQVDEGAVVRIMVQRNPNPHNIELVYVYAVLDVEPGTPIRYQVKAEGSMTTRTHGTWEDSIYDAIGMIDAGHQKREDAMAAEKEAIARQQGNKQTAVDELKLFVSQLEDCEVG